jgi:transposase
VLTVDDYGTIRRARRDGKSIRQIARAFNLSRITIRKVLNHPEPTPAIRNRSAPMLGPFQTIIDQVLVDDETDPPKQRHTAAQPLRRLRDEHGYAGGYAQVQRYLLKHRRRHQETFIPLGHLPGRRLEVDFGHIHVDFPDGRRQVPFLVNAWAYSSAPFVLALPFERTEAILEGTVATLILPGANASFIGAMPRWPLTPSLTRSAACRLAATSNPTPRGRSRPSRSRVAGKYCYFPAP